MQSSMKNQAPRRTKGKDILHLTREESESMGVEFQEEPSVVPEKLREHPLHEQVIGALTEDDVAEALTGEVTSESREEMEDFFADKQEEAADNQDEATNNQDEAGGKQAD